MKKQIQFFLIFLMLVSTGLQTLLNESFGRSQDNFVIQQDWVARFNGISNTTDKANDITVDALGNVYVTGESEVGSVTRDYVTVKYNSSGVQQWAARYNGPDNYIDQAYSVAVDNNSGSVYVTGGSRGIGTERDFCTIKYNTSGDSVWTRRYNGPGNDIDEAVSVVLDNSGFVYVTGYSDGGINLDFYTIKYDTNGRQFWATRYSGPAESTGSEDRPHSLAVDDNGNVYVTGESSTGFGFLDMYATIKYNSSGDSVWVSRYKGSGDAGLSQPYALAVDPNGNVYVTGRSDDSSGFGFNFDILTIKYSSSGDSLWVNRYNGQGNSSDVANAIALDGAGNVYVTGLTVGTTADYCTIKYNSIGDTQWVKTYNGPVNGIDVAYSMASDGSDNIYVTGYSAGSGNDYATVKYNSSGIQQWVQRYNGPGNGMDQASNLFVDFFGNVYVTGESIGTGSGSDYATIKYSQFLNIQLTALIEGFYNSGTNTMTADTVSAYLRNTSSPYAVVDSAKGFLNSSGNGIISFVNASNGVPYYFVVKHRNSIETWSASGITFTLNHATYNFTTSASTAYGDNLKLKGSRYCIYSGDVNQEGDIDVTDLILVFNDAGNFVTGYVVTDVNGDNFVDVMDMLIAYNNSVNFVVVRNPIVGSDKVLSVPIHHPFLSTPHIPSGF